MKKGGDHHVFGDGESGVASLTHDQGCNSQKMRHVRNICPLAPLDVEDARIFDCARKPAGQVQLSARIVVCTLVFCSHSASIWIVSSISSEWNGYLEAGVRT
jgi:altronate dehydratase